MRMKASLGMVCEFCTMIQATSEQRLSSWHTAIWTGRLRVGYEMHRERLCPRPAPLAPAAVG